MFKLDDCVGFITNTAAKKIADAFNEKLSHYGITRVQWIALYFLGQNESMNQSDLAKKMNIKNSTMVRLIDRLEKEGYVERVKDIKDRRITNLSLTEVGIKRREELLPVGIEFSDLASKGVSNQDIKTFKDVLNKMIINVE